jgi:hypothetical protein
VEVLDLDKFAGGITPVRRGGGEQTKTLRFRNKKGVEYKFRSINKDPSKTLPEELRETLASDLIQDQTSSANPMAPLVVPPILNALDILQAEPILCVLPDSKKLGEYREEFGGLLGMIEIHPDEFEDEDENFMGADKISGTDKLIERLKEDNDEIVDAAGYLKARLADFILGDWDRHIDQWRWARYEINNKKFWYPVPRDRDQAFAKFDGIFPAITAMAVTQLEHFSEDYPDVEGISWSGRFTDRRFLNRLTKSEWDSVTAYVQAALTDSVFDNAVKKLPGEMYSKAGEEIYNVLKARRDKLKEISDDFYNQTIKYADIHCSDKDEYAEINRINNSEVEVKIYDFDKDRKIKPEPLYQRIFSSDETSEIRIILYGGDDKAVVNGEVDESIKIYITGDKGKDTLIDNSLVKGYFLNVLPVRDAENKTIFFDDGGKTVFKTGSSTSVKKAKYEGADLIETPRDWGHDWKLAPWFNVNPDDGLFIGGGGILYEFGFRRRPYVYRMELTGGYAIHANRFRVRYIAEYNPEILNTRFHLEAKSSGLEVLNFYGFGNETASEENLKENDYYKVKQQQIYIKPSAEYFISSVSTINIGLQLKYSDTDDGPFLFEHSPYGEKNMLLFNLSADYIYDTRSNKDFPVSGIYFLTSGKYFPPLNKSQSPFYKLQSEARLFFSGPDIRLSSLAFKIGGEKIWGRFPFFEAAFLGGEMSLRGYDRNRFAGDASIYSSLEARFFIAQAKILVPVYFGITALVDAGKVFYRTENSGKIRNSYGGGIWMSFVKPEYLLALYAAKSPEDTGLYLNMGFLF